MVLKIVLDQTDYDAIQRVQIASIMIAKSDYFSDNGEKKTFECSFSGRNAMSKLAQTRRAIMRFTAKN